MSETDAERLPDNFELPDDAEMFFTVEFYQDEEGNIFTTAEGTIHGTDVRDTIAFRLEHLAATLRAAEAVPHVH